MSSFECRQKLVFLDIFCPGKKYYHQFLFGFVPCTMLEMKVYSL